MLLTLILQAAPPLLDLTEPVMQALSALLVALIPLAVTYASVAFGKAQKALGVERYTAALQAFDAELYQHLLNAGKVALARAVDHADMFRHEEIEPYLYRQATTLSRAFEEKAGVRVDLNEQRVQTLIKLSLETAKDAYDAQKRAAG